MERAESPGEEVCVRMSVCNADATPHTSSTRQSVSPCRRAGFDTPSVMDDRTHSPMDSWSWAAAIRRCTPRSKAEGSPHPYHSDCWNALPISLSSSAGPDLPGGSELRARLEGAGAWTDPTRRSCMLRAITWHRIPVMSDMYMPSRAIPCSTEKHLGLEVVRQITDPRKMPGWPPTKTAGSR